MGFTWWLFFCTAQKVFEDAIFYMEERYRIFREMKQTVFLKGVGKKKIRVFELVTRSVG
jgi:hypothetical protein